MNYIRKIFVFAAFVLLGLVVLTVASAEASSYKIGFNQVKDKLVVKEIIDGIEKEAYVTQKGLEKSEKGYYFVKKIVFNKSYDEVEIRLNLDVGVIIQNSEAYPSGYSIESDGQIISLVWKIKNVKAGENFAIFVELKDTKKELNVASILIIILIVILVVAYVYYKIQKAKKVAKVQVKPKKKPRTLEVEKYLLDNEKRVIEELENEPRKELWQKTLQIRTGLSKVKLSRILKNLEVRGLITKISFGKTNKIILKQ